ncbi:MAG TPA: protoporphyrinogen oxidase [Candidatus Acidoferrales bacterium]|nr:protoporphyrinogen oxidase [Candidatus Acidoferrales bacterium]
MSDAFEPVDLAVIGAGISGLACAFWVKQQGRSVIVFESSERAGGCIKSVQTDRYIADGGPQSYLSSELLARLINEAKLEGLAIPASSKAARPYLYVGGRLVAVPQSPQQALFSPFLSPMAKMRALVEPLVARRADGEDESVAQFVRRRGGVGVLDRVVAPYVSGIFAGDPAELSMSASFPTVAELEQRHGSVLRGMMARRRAASGQAAPRRRSFGFRGGNDVLVRGLAEHLATDVRLNSPVKALWQRGAWMEMLVGGKTDARVVAKEVVIAAPAEPAGQLLEDLEPKSAAALRSFIYPTVVQIVLAYPKDAIGVDLEGFGFLVPRSQGLRILGCVWNSVMFPDRCPEDEVLVTAFLGGATDSAVAAQSDEVLARQAHDDVRKALRIGDVAPQVVAGFRWQEAIPQYNIGHAGRLKLVREGLRRLPHVKLCGSYLKSPSVADCIATAALAADVGGD